MNENVANSSHDNDASAQKSDRQPDHRKIRLFRTSRVAREMSRMSNEERLKKLDALYGSLPKTMSLEEARAERLSKI